MTAIGSRSRHRRRHGSRRNSCSFLSSSSFALGRSRFRDGFACYCCTRRRDRRRPRRCVCSRTIAVNTVVCRGSLCSEAYVPEQDTLVLCA